jgi:uridine phosphorylase
MECSALYALSAMLGHEALTLCIAIANRVTKKVLGDYQPYMEKLIRTVLETLTEND